MTEKINRYDNRECSISDDTVFNYVWRGKGWYGFKAEGADLMVAYKVNMDGWQEHECCQAARQQGLGTPRWMENEAELRAITE